MVVFEMKRLSDENLVPRLLAIYESITPLRSWFTFTFCARARCVKACYSVHLVIYNVTSTIPLVPHPYRSHSLPQRQASARLHAEEYEIKFIDPKIPKEEFFKWFQATTAVLVAYPRRPETLALCNVLEHIPKDQRKENDF